MNQQENPSRNDGSQAPSPAPSGPVVVGIGASAGGLSALKTFFNNVPADSGLAFVVVVHLSAEHKSHLADLLQLRAPIPVQQVTETTEILPNRAYVIPPGYNLSAIDTHLRPVALKSRREEHTPIDHFLRTLAATHDGHAIGVILTGTGSDGTLGIREVKEKGGLVIVQDPNEAEYDGMPQSAIATGLADLVLPVAEIPAAIRRIARTQPEVTIPADGAELDRGQLPTMQSIFSLLRAQTGRDYSHYKTSTTMRRISRRMQLNYTDTLSAYLQKLREYPDEIRALSDDLLITVTNFFRDADVFQGLEKDVIPKLFEGKKFRQAVRVWSVGCATGEEAYSLAILLIEAAGHREDAVPIQVFATDLHAPSLAKAREGFYPSDIEADVSPERLRRFFHRQGEGYRIRKEVRDLIVFSEHNVLSDPPFSRIDLISCRNMLIYLQPRVQEEVIGLFHYATNPQGYLVLGPSENAHVTDLFRPVDKAQKILQRRNVPAPEPHLPVFPFSRPAWGTQALRTPPTRESLSYGALHFRLISQYSSPSVLVGPEDRVVHISEHAERYLGHPGGELTQNIIKLARAELRVELVAALNASRVEKRPAFSKPIKVHYNRHPSWIVIQVRPALEADAEGYFLVSFEERRKETRKARGALPPAGKPEDREEDSDLALTKQRLQAVIDQYQTSQEEMKASNEELQSTNEELRSTLEELETSKEELQSMNEELQTVNQENRHKVEELGLLSTDLQNLLTATEIATLFLDREFRILRFTPKLGDLFNVRMMDRGRPISDITHKLGDVDVQADAAAVIEGLTTVEREVQDQAGSWYRMRLRPYRSSDEHIEGVVVTFLDVTVRKHTEDALRASEERLAHEAQVRSQLQEMFLAIVSAWSFGQAASSILKTAIRLLSADSGRVLLVEDETGELVFARGQGIGKHFAEFFARLDADDRCAGRRALRTRCRVIVEDIDKDEDYAPYREEAAEAGLRALQTTPLIDSAGKVIGLLSTYFRQVRSLTERDEQILDLVSRGASVLLERLRAADALKQLTASLEKRVEERTQQVREKEHQVRELASQTVVATQTERNRIAQVLHDDLQQLLFAIEMKLNAFAEDPRAVASPEMIAEVTETQGWIKRSIDITRRLALDLSMQVLEKQSFDDALRSLAAQMREVHGLNVDLKGSSSPSMSHETRLVLFGIVRELLFNVVKHGGTDRASVEVGGRDSECWISVRDQGRGFDPAAAVSEDGYGMSRIRREVTLRNGRVQVDAAPGKGVSVTVAMPLNPG